MKQRSGACCPATPERSIAETFKPCARSTNPGAHDDHASLYAGDVDGFIEFRTTRGSDPGRQLDVERSELSD
jgi:hypothetical protein